MTVTRVRAAITQASADKRITENDAKSIGLAALTGADGKPDGLTTSEAKALAAFYEQATAPGSTVKLGAPAETYFRNLFFSSSVPVGQARNQVISTLQQALPFEPGPKLSRAPSTRNRFELPLGKDPELPNGPNRTAFFDPEKKTFFLKLTKGSRSSWAGPLGMYRPDGPGAAKPQPFQLSVAGGVKVSSSANPTSFLLSGGIPAGGSLSLDLGNGTKVKVQGPIRDSYGVFRALERALPSGHFARTGGRWIEEYIRELPSTDSRVISLWKGDKPGELAPADLHVARTLKRVLSNHPEGTAPPAAEAPAWSSRAGLFATKKGSGQALVKVALERGRVALVDPKLNQVFFAKEGASRALREVTGPVPLTGASFLPANRFFTWKELAALSDRAEHG